MGNSLDEIKKVDETLADDPVIVEIAEDLDKAEELALFARSRSGKEAIKKIGNEVYAVINELFDSAREPKLENLLGVIARLEAKMQVYAMFTGAKDKATTLFDILTEKLGGKSGD